MEFFQDFPDDAACLDWLWRHIYSPDGKHAHCPRCDQERAFYRVRTRPLYSCANCGKAIHPTAGTIFHKSSTSLKLWFYAVFLMSQTRCGISAKQLERELGVTYKTAWRMFNRIRKLLSDEFDGPFTGTVEMDETFIGGKMRGNKGGRRLRGTNKTAVFGMVERGGRVVAMPVEATSKEALYPHIQKHVLPEAVVYTDEWSTYTGLKKEGYTKHRRIKHALEIYVMGDVHTNTIEGFWSLLKRGISGVYHQISSKYVQDYLNEYAYRYNHRDDAKPIFWGLVEKVGPDDLARFGLAPLAVEKPS